MLEAWQAKALDACEQIIASARVCDTCAGNGLDPVAGEDACFSCGGYGERLGGDCMEALHAARAAIKLAKETKR